MVLVMVTSNSTERDGRVGARGASAMGRLVGVVSIFLTKNSKLKKGRDQELKTGRDQELKNHDGRQFASLS